MSRIIVISLFAACAVGFGVLALLARRPNSKIPSFGEVCGFVMRYEVGRFPVGRVAVLGFWWWVGWHFFAR
jgi:Family of unknown function (DUF6186)